jgi:hypothetical protein
MKLDVKTIGGVGGGVALGYFVFKTKNPLILIALGVGGGLIASQVFKTKADKSQDADKALEAQIIEDINNNLDTGEDSSSVEGMSFNPNVGYITPHGTVVEQNPQEFMDLSL